MIKKIIVLLVAFVAFQSVVAQEMTNERIEAILTEVTNNDDIKGYPGHWEMMYREHEILCLTDKNHNRMRIITPVIEEAALKKDLLLDILTANFHAALDVKYALSQGYLWSVYIHPLKQLSEYELKSAMDQVVNAADNFGTTFSSTEMIFGGMKKEKEDVQPIEKPVLQQL